MEKKKSNIKNIVIGILVLLLGLSLVYIGYIKLNNKDNKEKNDISNVQEENNTQESVEDWLKKNNFIIVYLENYKKDTATIKDYSKIVIYYLVTLCEKTYYEDDNLPFKMENGFVLMISKEKVKKLLNEHFGVKNTIINLEQFNNNGLKFHEDDNNYYMDIHPTEGTSDNHKLVSINFKNENQIEAIYELYSTYPDTNGTPEEDDDIYPYQGSKKIILSKTTSGYQILESITEKVK